VEPKIKEIEISVCMDELLGPLGYSEKDDIQPAIMDQIVSEKDDCIEAMSGNVIYTISEVRRLDGGDTVEIGGATIEDALLANSLDGAESVAIAICTVGPEIDHRISEYFGSGDYLRGMIADVVGSRAVENLAEGCGALICVEARERELSASRRRLSPGYRKWDVSGQRAVFAVLDPSPIGVTMNEHCMMQPNKSISFVVPLVVGESNEESGPPCAECGFPNCSYRRK